MSNEGGYGYAFPIQQNVLSGGMTLRDYFAAQAMIGFVSDTSYLKAFVLKQPEANGDVFAREIATSAYIIADAMLAERAK